MDMCTKSYFGQCIIIDIICTVGTYIDNMLQKRMYSCRH